MYRVGVDLGGTNIVAGVINEEMKIAAAEALAALAGDELEAQDKLPPRGGSHS